MKDQVIKLIARKVVTTLITAMLFALSFSTYGLIGNDSLSPYDRGVEFIGWASLFFYYGGIIIFIYGTAVSIVLELMLRKILPKYNWLYILFHGLFGGIFLFQDLDILFLGIVPAFLYGLVDRWLYTQNMDGRHIKFGLLIPVALTLILWGSFSLSSETRPPFTSEDAIERATSGEDTISSNFPKDKKKWNGEIEGFQVSRKSSARKRGDHEYIVTFTESWEKGYLNGTYKIHYIVDRNTVSLHSESGLVPPYYKK